MSTTTEQPELRTRMFARVLGPFFVIFAVTTVARASDMRRLLSDFEANSALPWVTASFLLLVALAIVGLHQYWRGAAAIIVSVVGWVFALRAIFLMAFPHAFMGAADAAMRMTALWVSVTVFLGLVGLYLTYVGWKPVPAPPSTQARASSPDIPRAA
ncbi:hypothetical protein A5682_22185 [Mycobacterium mantenii]|uniref:Uncharacterized protein n=2 Tax=Mycobacterium mantenii TaxID=560555 RepID=A0A1A2TMG9_MYCNT|nr:hypothetical protein A5688_22285 [Mycobacterium mantenii]OBH50832.1 hypothetical protein A5687_12540 [Mycobacterium mantenii]OBH65583.1 hypothetical protein A5683_12020 [Mycobacterium mantenii]OBH77633.1 hypothetical protein A5682_22185 [Mycobacterium mantenii]